MDFEGSIVYIPNIPMHDCFMLLETLFNWELSCEMSDTANYTHNPITLLSIPPFHISTNVNTKSAFDANSTVTIFIDFKFICLTKKLIYKSSLCNNIINNEPITIHNVPITVSSACMLHCSGCTLWLWSSLSESAYETCTWEWLAIAELRSSQVVPVWCCLAPPYQLSDSADPTNVRMGSSPVNRQATPWL